MQVESDYCLLLALPCGRDQEDVVSQTESLKAAFISYLQAKQAAGIINVPNPGSNQVRARNSCSATGKPTQSVTAWVSTGAVVGQTTPTFPSPLKHMDGIHRIIDGIHRIIDRINESDPKAKKNPNVCLVCSPFHHLGLKSNQVHFPALYLWSRVLVSSPYPDFSRTAGVFLQNAFGAVEGLSQVCCRSESNLTCV